MNLGHRDQGQYNPLENGRVEKASVSPDGELLFALESRWDAGKFV